MASRRTPRASTRKTTGRRRPQRRAAASEPPRVAILMGSASDWEVMKAAAEALEGLGIPYEARITSAHRTPERHQEYVLTAEERGIEVIIAGAGMAAHLAGVTAAHTLLPVLGVPIGGSALNGMDALLATVQMPGGIPVGTLAIGRAGAKNAGLLAGAILARSDADVRSALAAFRRKQTAGVPERPDL
ncbi:MAG: 5-(carboxyamino)imidazole ribonucleotide mutase [Myxococcota bacterium]|nr:5-(carboxyamino)imidazole ribonucleotide mutase [Myxococcota bacterium]